MADPLTIGRTVLGHTEKEAIVKEYLRNGGVNLDPETQAWCAAFVNSTLAQAGLPTGGNAAQSFLDYGEPVWQPHPGDIGVFARHEDPQHKDWKGHAGFYEGTNQYGDAVLLSGNAGDAVMEHSIDDDRALGYRRLPGRKDPPLPDILSAAVSPEVRRGMETVDYGGGHMLEQRIAPETSPVDEIGGTTTPSIAGAYRKKKFWDNYERDQNSIASVFENRFAPLMPQRLAGL
jgi:uncharacterized protein (TIGR02594 family)